MKITRRLFKICLLSLVMIMVFFPGTGQKINKINLEKYSSQLNKQLSGFYELNNYNFYWINSKHQQSALIELINSGYLYGLNERDYHFHYLQTERKWQKLLTAEDSIEADILFSDAALHYFNDLHIGNKAPAFAYNGLKFQPGNIDVAKQLSFYLKQGNLGSLVSSIQPVSPEYISVLSKMNKLQHIARAEEFKDAKIISKKTDSTNKLLLLRLYQLGITDTLMQTIGANDLSLKLKFAQEMFNLKADGIVGNETLKAFNVPVQKRIEGLFTLINYLRWLHEAKRSSVLLLNIAAAGFMVYEEGKIVLDSKIIAGKPSTPTPTLSSTISEVIIYPYWNVPYKIATRELLPRIKRNSGYLSANNYQVLNREGRVVSPYNINWRALSAGYFPYTIRQSTGCDNALGIVKFNFYNPFTVYLHDTPTKKLFSQSSRFYSHGCMRVEKPIELAHILLGENKTAIDTITEKGCLLQQAPKVISNIKPMPVIVLYSTTWFDKNGNIRYYKDVYGKEL